MDHDIDRVAVRDARMELSARGLADLATRPRQHEPISVGQLVVEDMTLAVLPTALFPGLGRVEAVVTAAEASDVELSSGRSWLRGTSQLEGRVSVPGGIAMGMAYRTDRLTLTGGPLGPLPITVPLRMPSLDESARELDYLRALATGVIRAAGARLLGKKAVDSALRALEDLMKR